MSAKFQIEDRSGATLVVTVVGQLTLREGSCDLHDLIQDLVAKGHRRFVFNVAGVSYTDSSGIGELVIGSVLIENNGGKIKLAVLTQRVRDILERANLCGDGGFQIYKTVEEAVASNWD